MKLRDITHGEHVKKGLYISWNRIPHMTIVYFLVKFLKKTKITPNQITLFSNILRLFAVGFFAFGNTLQIAIGGVLIYFSYVFDVVDGSLARAIKKFSPLGEWYDRLGDQIFYALFFLSIPHGIALRTGLNEIWMWSLIAFAGYESIFIIQEHFKKIFSFGFDIIKRERKKRRMIRDLMLNDFFITHTLAIAAIFNILGYYMIFLSIYSWIFVFPMAIVMTYKAKKLIKIESLKERI